MNAFFYSTFIYICHYTILLIMFRVFCGFFWYNIIDTLVFKIPVCRLVRGL